MTDFSPVPEQLKLDQTVDRPPHPDNAAITSPAEAAKFLAQEPRADAVSAADGQRCAWLTGGGTRDEAYVLNWSGPLDSSWDYVTFGFDLWSNGDWVSVTDDGVFGYAWQWASRGSSYTVGWTPSNLQDRGGINPRAVYAVWSRSQGGYWGEPPC